MRVLKGAASSLIFLWFVFGFFGFLFKFRVFHDLDFEADSFAVGGPCGRVVAEGDFCNGDLPLFVSEVDPDFISADGSADSVDGVVGLGAAGVD